MELFATQSATMCSPAPPSPTSRRTGPSPKTTPTTEARPRSNTASTSCSAKTDSSQAHADWGFPATTVPFSMVLGPHNAMTDREQRMFARLQAGRPILVPGDGSTRLQVGDVDDQARALEQLMGRPATFGRRYNLTGAESVTRNEYIALCAAAVGVDADVHHIPADVMEDLWTGERSIDIVQQSGALDIRSSGNAKQDAQACEPCCAPASCSASTRAAPAPTSTGGTRTPRSASIGCRPTSVDTRTHHRLDARPGPHLVARQRPSRHGLRLDYRGPDPGDARRITVQRHATPAPQPM